MLNLLCVLLLLPQVLFAQTTNELKALNTIRLLNNAEISLFKDASSQLSLTEVLKLPSSVFTPVQLPFNGGYTRASYWFKIQLHNSKVAIDIPWFLSASPSYLDHLYFYTPDSLGYYHLTEQAGDQIEGVKRPQDKYLGSYSFALPELNESSTTYYLRLQTHSLSTLTLHIGSQTAMLANNSNKGLMNGVFIGFLLLLFINALLMWSWLLQPIYLLFLGYILGGLMLLLASNGVASQFLFKDNVTAVDLLAPAGSCLMMIFSIGFFLLIFETKRYFPYIHRFFIALITLASLTLLSIPLGHYVDIAPITNLLILLALPLALYTSWRAIDLQLYGSRTIFYGYVIHVGITALNLLAINNIIPAYPGYLSSSQISLTILLIFLQQGLYQRMRATEKLQQDSILRAKIAESMVHIETQRRQDQGTFLNIIAHELKTPLAIIDSAIQSLEKIQSINHDTLINDRHIRIRQSVAKLNNLLENALSVERYENYPLEPRITEINLHTFIKKLVKQNLPENRVCELNISAHEKFYADQTLLNLALSNLLVNAHKYSLAQSNIKFDVKPYSENGIMGILFSLTNLYRDSLKPDCSNWFNKYYRQHDHPNIEGLGLGLYLVSQITTTLDGKVYGSAIPSTQDWLITINLWLPNTLRNHDD